MPNIKSAAKRVKTAEKKNLQNRSIKSEVNTAIKKFKAAVYANNVAEAEALLPQTVSIIDSAASKGVFHKNKANNKKAALATLLHNLKTGKLEKFLESKVDNRVRIAEKRAREEQERLEARKAREEARAQKEAEKANAKKDTKKAPAKKAKEAATEEAPKKTPKKKTEEPKEE